MSPAKADPGYEIQKTHSKTATWRKRPPAYSKSHAAQVRPATSFHLSDQNNHLAG
jgi:hypothetical protein